MAIVKPLFFLSIRQEICDFYQSPPPDGLIEAVQVGQTLIGILDAIIQGGRLFAGLATTATNPGSSDAPRFYIASEPGSYANFPTGNGDATATVLPDEAALLANNVSGRWDKIVLPWAPNYANGEK